MILGAFRKKEKVIMYVTKPKPDHCNQWAIVPVI